MSVQRRDNGTIVTVHKELILYKWLLLFMVFFFMTFWSVNKGFCDVAFSNYHVELEFRHYIHTEGQGIACTICHTQRKNGSYRMIGHSACASCHLDQIENHEFTKHSCGFCHPSMEINGKDSAKAILQMKKPPRGIFKHTEYLDNICYICHGAMLEEIVELGKLQTNDEMRRVREISHRFHFAESCEKCHEGMASDQAPENHEKDWGNQHRQAAPTFNCRICHQKSFCQSCHDDVY